MNLNFHKLYRDLYRPLVSYALSFINDIAIAEDIVQDVMLYVWEHKPEFYNSSAIRNYLYRSVHNASIKLLAHGRVVDSYKTSCHVSADGDSIEDDVFYEDVYEELFRAIRKLPAKEREVMLLSIEHNSNKEIADILKISVETVKTHKKRSMVSLRKTLNRDSLRLLLLLLFNA